MALPANLLHLSSRLREAVEPAQLAESLPLGLGGLDAILPDHGLPRGGVVELAITGAMALSTSLSLAACRSAQQRALARGGTPPWCAFVDPSGTLHGPGVSSAGVELDRFLVVRPPLEALGRIAVRLAESHAFSVLVIDTLGTMGSSVNLSLGSWPRLVRRLSIAAAESSSVVLLLTDKDARRTLPLPVAMRIELRRPRLDQLTLRVAKDRRGRIGAERTIPWQVSGGSQCGFANEAPVIKAPLRLPDWQARREARSAP